MQIRKYQVLSLAVLLAGAVACNKSDSEHQQTAATASGEENAELIDDDAETAVSAHQEEPEHDAVARRDRPDRDRAEARSEAAEEAKEDAEAQKVASDNTGRNKRDQEDAITPMDQGESERDIEITRRIREAVVGNDSLSFMAKNAKVITLNGRVTLRGPVHSEDERKLIEAAARSVVGADQVVSQLEVK